MLRVLRGGGWRVLWVLKLGALCIYPEGLPSGGSGVKEREGTNSESQLMQFGSHPKLAGKQIHPRKVM